MKRGRALPLRLWLILTVLAVVVSTGVAWIALAGAMGSWQSHADNARLLAVRRIIGADPAAWHNPTWQRTATGELTLIGVEAQIVQITDNASGHLVDTTPGASAFLSTGSRSQAGTGKYATQGPTNELIPISGRQAPTFEKILISGPARHSPPLGIAFLWFTRLAPGSPSPILWPLAAAGVILVVVVVALLLFSRSVLKPLAAMNRAVEGIAGGDLDVRLPRSAAREVAEVSTALEAMSAALRDALTRQTQLEEDRKLFIGAIAHDLRTPLFMLRGYLQGLESGVAATPAKRALYISACRAKADALERLISDLFAYTRLEYLEQQPERVQMELGALLEGAVEGVQPLAAAKGISLTVDPPDEPCLVLGDTQMLARVVENLLDNALRHTPESERIEVRWRRQGGCVLTTVTDSGPGIADQDLPHLFTALYRGETSRNRRTGGAGLGLTIAQRIMRAHGGDLIAANDPNGGAVFTATLPAIPISAQVPELIPAASSSRS